MFFLCCSLHTQKKVFFIIHLSCLQNPSYIVSFHVMKAFVTYMIKLLLFTPDCRIKVQTYKG